VSQVAHSSVKEARIEGSLQLSAISLAASARST
jgi:hypothetical protein